MMTTIIEALKQNNFLEVEKLISEKNNINKIDNTGLSALHIAVLKQNIDIVHSLLNAGANPNISSPPEKIQPTNKKIKIDEETIQNINKLGNKTPLHIASKEGFYDIVKLLLAYKADPNIIDSGHCTPLHWATVKQNIKLVELLLENGANPNAKDLANSTPLHEAVRKNNFEITKLLLKFKADPIVIDITGFSAVDLAKPDILQLIFNTESAIH